MAIRQDSGSNPSQNNEDPNLQDDDRIPEFTDNARGRAEDDDAEDLEIDDEDMEEADEDDGTA